MQIRFFIKTLMIALISLPLFFSCSSSNVKSVAQELNVDQISIIPQPQSIHIYSGTFTVSENTTIQINEEYKNTANLLNSYLGTNLKINTKTEDNKNGITFTQIVTEKKEGYELKISKHGIKIKGDESGLFYGMQTLIQLLNESKDGKTVPCVLITDYPEFGWRGMHFDVSRHFFKKDFIKQYIDILAIHKLNVFHWHLTDDQGWRIEIDKYPNLTKAGAYRRGNQNDEWDYDIHGVEEGQPSYGGFYTKKEILEILKYAKERHVTVVPEIELPAHSWAALHAYPNLSCTGKDWHMGSDWSFSDPFCAGNEETFQFFEDVLTEVIDLFPSQYIHIGGDEAQKTKWEQCSKCQARIKEEGLKDEHELQSYFIKRIATFVQSKGRKIIGWDEILEGGLAPDAAVMSWRGEEGGIKAAKLHHEVIMTPQEFLYFNKAQSNPQHENIKYEAIIDLEKVYHYSPVPQELAPDERKYIKGVEGCLWTEFVNSEDIAIDRLLPRVLALSEIAWTSQNNKSWSRFQDKLNQHFSFLDHQGINYFVASPKSNGLNVFVTDNMNITLSQPINGSQIRFTLDGSIPDNNSNLYTDPITISQNTQLKAITILSTGKSSAVFEKEYRKESYQEATPLNNPKEGITLNIYDGSIKKISEFDQLELQKKATIVNEIKIPEGMPKDFFGLKFQGYIKVLQDGIYSFSSTSDDGSAIYINDKMIVINDGLHGMQEAKGQVPLKAGFHKIDILYFEGTGGQGLVVKMQQNSNGFDIISSEMLFNDGE